jgi:hypothetical protein
MTHLLDGYWNWFAATHRGVPSAPALVAKGTLFGRLLSPMAGAEPDFARDASAVPGMVMGYGSPPGP